MTQQIIDLNPSERQWLENNIELALATNHQVIVV